MRPYFAIIKDSFREALASRVLWVVFALITVTLLTIAPLTYREEVTVGLREGDVEAWPLLVEQLREASESKTPNPGKRIVSLMDEDGKKLVREFKGMPEQPTMRDVRELQRSARTLFESLNKVLRRDDLYDPESWRGVGVSRELQELRKTPYDELADRDRQRFNRLLFEAAFPDLVSASSATSFQFRYAFWDLGLAVPIRKQQFTESLMSQVPWLIDKGILSIGLLIAVLVTAPIIPQMFDPGSLHLLLSKPISRPLLYVSKFLGGCAFVTLAAGYFFLGVYLIFGVRWGIWEPRLLWCVPVYVFVFATYYSVTALAGAVWRNTIVAVIVTFLFWVTCFSVGTGQSMLEGMMLRYRLARIVPTSQGLVAADEVNTLLAWDDKTPAWKVLPTSPEQEQIRTAMIVFRLPHPDPMVGPVYDEANEQVVAAAPSFKMLGRMTMVSARQGSAWKASEGSPPAGQPIALLTEPDGRPLLVTNSGLARVVRNLSSETVMLRMPGFSIPLTRAEAIESVGPTPSAYWGDPAAAAIDPTSGRLFVYSRGMLTSLTKDSSGEYRVELERRISDDDRDPAVLAATNGVLFVARKDRTIQSIDAVSLVPADTYELPGRSPPRSAVATADGKSLFILAHDGYLHQLDLASGKFSRPPVRGQGTISAILLDANSLYVAWRALRVVQYDPATWSEVRSFAPPLDMQERAFYWIIQPLHRVLPKPGEFYKTVEYLLTKQATTSTSGEESNLATAQARLDPWAPVWSGFAFQAVMLLLGCLYIQRQEF